MVFKGIRWFRKRSMGSMSHVAGKVWLRVDFHSLRHDSSAGPALMMSGVPGVEPTWGAWIQHLLILSGRNLSEGLEEVTHSGCWCRGKGQPGCRFCLTDDRPVQSWVCGETIEISLLHPLPVFRKKLLTERKKESLQSPSFRNVITPWLLVASPRALKDTVVVNDSAGSVIGQTSKVWNL